MNQERLEILKMVAEKVISVEEAERLLKVLEESGAGPTGGGGSPGKPASGQRGALDSVAEFLANIGPSVKNVVAQAAAAMSSVASEFAGESGSEEEEVAEGQPVDLSGGRIPLPANSRISIRSSRPWGVEGADLTIEGVEGWVCQVEGGQATNLKAYRGQDRLDLRWETGPLTVKFPSRSGRLYASTMGGKIQVGGVARQMHLRTFAGAIDLRDLRCDFSARTLGGPVRASLAPGWKGEGEVVSIGGEVTLVVPAQVSAEVTLLSRGGRVEIPEGMAAVQWERSTARQQATIILGDRELESTLVAKSMGGLVRLSLE
ncbi:MAG: hypothetical protein JW797_17710 [Bradymonadales bacterium]|nr:hypothetical protein [Bradymonadales bacterium]